MAAKAPAVASYLWGQKAAQGSFLSCPSTDRVLGVWGLCLMAKGALSPTLELAHPVFSVCTSQQLCHQFSVGLEFIIFFTDFIWFISFSPSYQRTQTQTLPP